MTIHRVVIVSDDPTGAIDTAVEFSSRGYTTKVALTPDAIGQCIGDAPQVLSVSTNSREISGVQAIEAVGQAAQSLAAYGPDIWIKKVDSRLKGNIGLEVGSLGRSVGFDAAVFIPAIPWMNRMVTGGQAVGDGIAKPVNIRPLVSGLTFQDVDVPDIHKQADIEDAVQRGIYKTTLPLFIGAAGLARAIATALRPAPLQSSELLLKERPFFVIGSRDPLTLAQVKVLQSEYPEIRLAQCPNGAPPPASDAQWSGAICTQGATEEPAESVESRFAKTSADLFNRFGRDVLFGCGGNTLSAMLRELEIQCLQPVHEVVSGIAVSNGVKAQQNLVVLSKSGGFGDRDSLVKLVRKTNFGQ